MPIPDSLLRLAEPLAHTLQVVPGESLLFLLAARQGDGSVQPLTGITAHLAITRMDGVVVVDRDLAALGDDGVIRVQATAVETAGLALDTDMRGLVLGTYRVDLSEGSDRKVVLGGSLKHPVVGR